MTKINKAFFKSLLLTLATSAAVAAAPVAIHFNNEMFTLKYSIPSLATNGYINEYFKGTDNINQWSKMIGVYHFPTTSSPIAAAKVFEKQIENSENSTLVKFIENKKQDKALVSFLTVNNENFRNYFEYDIYKYEKHPTKGVLLTRYGEKYFFKSDDEIAKIGQSVRAKNDELMEILITSPQMDIIEKEVVEE